MASRQSLCDIFSDSCRTNVYHLRLDVVSGIKVMLFLKLV